MDMRPPQGSIEAKDPFAAPIPGHSLTEDNTKWAWGNPQKVVDPEKALSQAIRGVKSPKLQLEMVKLLMVGTSVLTFLRHQPALRQLKPLLILLMLNL